MAKKVLVLSGIAAIVLVGVLFVWQPGHALRPAAAKAPIGQTVAKYTHLDITLKNGQLVGPPSVYLVNPGTNLEFSVATDKMGKIGIPSDPPQTINFSQSPVIFRLTASTSGKYPLSFQADDSSQAVLIGTIQVR